MAKHDMWPTPKASAAGPDFAKMTRSGTGISLQTAVAMWPTPTAQDAKNNGAPSQMERNTKPLNAEVGGALNPTWVEWLMGWPLGWTDCAASGTDRFRQWLRSHGSYCEADESDDEPSESPAENRLNPPTDTVNATPLPPETPNYAASPTRGGYRLGAMPCSIFCIREADAQIAAGNRSGNFVLVTAAKLRRVVAMMDAEAVRAELLAGMGITAEVSPLDAGIMIEVRTPHSLQTVMNALRSTFDVLGAMGRNGRMGVKVMIPNEPKIS